jgi:hypothetical protein
MKEGDPDWEQVVDSLEVVGPLGGKDERFQLLTTGLQLPACSFISRTDDDVWFIDTGVENDLGVMYIGERDFSGMASLAGFISKASASRIFEENGRLRSELDLARSLITDLRAAVAGLVGASPVERSEISAARKRTDRLELESLGEETDSSDLDLDAI